MSILSDLKVVCPFPQVFEEVEDPGAIVLSYRRKIGHIRADYDGSRWWNTIWPMHNELASTEISKEIDAVYDALTAKDALADLKTLRAFCGQFPQAKASANCEDEYNFYYVGERCLYWMRFITRKGDYNLYLHIFLKSAEENRAEENLDGYMRPDGVHSGQ